MTTLPSAYYYSLFTTLLLLQLWHLPVKGHAGIRKRNVLYQFKPMVEALTGCSALDYIDYGCWCGLGHKAENIVDGIDGCCKVHDTCYGVLQDLYPSCSPYEASYGWTKSSSASSVSVSSASSSSVSGIKQPGGESWTKTTLGTNSNCTDTKDTCKYGTCLCDLAAARCFRQFSCPSAPEHQKAGTCKAAAGGAGTDEKHRKRSEGQQPNRGQGGYDPDDAVLLLGQQPQMMAGFYPVEDDEFVPMNEDVGYLADGPTMEEPHPGMNAPYMINGEFYPRGD